MNASIALAILLGLLGSSCGKRTVPFKRDGTDDARQAAAPDAAVASSGLPERPQGVVYPALTQRIEHRGRTLARTSGAVRAALELVAPPPAKPPTDRPVPEPDLLLAVEDSDGGLALERWRSDAGEWKVAERVATLMASMEQTGCALQGCELSALSPTQVAASAMLRCTPGNPPADHAPPAPGGTAPTAPLQQRLWAIALSTPARIIEDIMTSFDTSGGGLPIQAALTSGDLDGDGRSDLLISLAAAPGTADATPFELKLFDRAGGLIRDSSEPEKTLRALADQAVEAQRKRDPSAAPIAERVLALHRSLCREGGSPGLLIGGRALECGPSLGAGRAASVRTALLSEQGKLSEALESYRALQRSSYQLTPADSARAGDALRSRAEQGYVWRTAISVDPGRAPDLRRGAIAFIDDWHILLRGPTPRSYDLKSSHLEPVGMAAGRTIIDPTARLALSAIRRGCDGYHLSLVRASQVVAGIVTGPPVAEPLIVRAPAPAHCPDPSAEERRDSGGFRALEWTAQGVLLARDQELYLLALDAAQASTAPPARPLGPRDATPPLVYSGEVTPDGRYHGWLTPIGVAIHDRQNNLTRFVAPPAGSGTPSDLALSPSGRTLALLRGNQLFIGQSEPPTPPP
jgi:hypothetical protein